MIEVLYLFGEILYFEPIVQFLYGHTTTFIFFMVLLVNFVRTSRGNSYPLKKQQAHEILILSLVMSVSYAIPMPFDYIYWLSEVRSVYMPNTPYMVLDILTILFIYSFVKIETNLGELCRFYLTVALGVNASLFFLLQLDLLLIHEGLKESGFWWFWTVFSYGINGSDLIMVLVLVVQKDFLGWYKLSEKIKGAYTRP